MKTMDGHGVRYPNNAKNNVVTNLKNIVGKTTTAMKTQTCAVTPPLLTANILMNAQKRNTAANTTMMSIMSSVPSVTNVRMSVIVAHMTQQPVSVLAGPTILIQLAMIPLDKNVVRITGAPLLRSVYLVNKNVVKLMETPMLEVNNSMKMINAAHTVIPIPLEQMGRMMVLVAVPTTPVLQILLTAVDHYYQMRNLLLTTQRLENVLLLNYHHAHVKDAVTSTVVMNWITSCTELTTITITLNMRTSIPSIQTGMRISSHGGTPLLEMELELPLTETYSDNNKYCHAQIMTS